MSLLSKNKLKVLFVTPEAKPFAMVGGLGAVMNSLPLALSKEGVDARIMTPRFLTIDDKKYNLSLEHKGLRVPTENQNGPKHLVCNVKAFAGDSRKGLVPAYFLENLEYYEQRANVYGYGDDAVRWALLSRGVIEFLKVSSWVPDVIVSADFMAGLIPQYLKTKYQDEKKLKNIKTVFTIHNLVYQGINYQFATDSDFDDGHSEVPAFEDPRLLKINMCRRGIMYSDFVTTVSEMYAKEIMTEQYGAKLDELLRERRAYVLGILNGIDYTMWNSKRDPLISSPFSATSFSARAANKKALQERFGLPTSEHSFLIGTATRIAAQKGFSLLTSIMEPLLNELDIQFILVGQGDNSLMEFFDKLQKKFPQKVALHLKFDSSLPHMIFAGADATLIPSKYEPSGLTQMEAMRYGCIPIARKTGGLADTIENYDPATDQGYGFLFDTFDSFPLMVALVRAYENFAHKGIWKKLQLRAMKKDFSWEKSAKKYVELFTRLVQMKSGEQK
jgi:starch synthase